MKDYTVPGVTAVPKDFLKVIADHNHVFTVESSLETVISYSLVRYDVATYTQRTLFEFFNDVNDIAISSSGKSMVMSTVEEGALFSSSDSGATWWMHEPQAKISRRMKV